MPTREGRIRPEFVWGTLDCPGAFAAQDPDDMRPALTGRMTAKVIEPPKVGERCAVVGWRIGEEGRKLYSGTALYTEAGAPLRDRHLHLDPAQSDVSAALRRRWWRCSSP